MGLKNLQKNPNVPVQIVFSITFRLLRAQNRESCLLLKKWFFGIVLYRDKPGEFPHREEYKCPI